MVQSFGLGLVDPSQPSRGAEIVHALLHMTAGFPLLAGRLARTWQIRTVLFDATFPSAMQVGFLVMRSVAQGYDRPVVLVWYSRVRQIEGFKVLSGSGATGQCVP